MIKNISLQRSYCLCNFQRHPLYKNHNANIKNKILFKYIGKNKFSFNAFKTFNIKNEGSQLTRCKCTKDDQVIEDTRIPVTVSS